MRLESFSVMGYKNFLEPVSLGELGAINIIHGENNVGKSNVLEAVHLFFKLLQICQERGLTPSGEPLSRDSGPRSVRLPGPRALQPRGSHRH